MSAIGVEQQDRLHANAAPAKAAPSALRVCLLAEAAGAGVGRHFFDLAEGLAALGVEVVGIYSPRRLDTACRERLASGRLPPMHALPMRRAVHPGDALDLVRLVRLLRKLGPFDLLHAHSSKGGALGRLAARHLGIPSVYTPHAFVTLDPTLPRWKRAMYGQVERRLARFGSAVIAVSREEVEHAKALAIDPGKIHVVANGIAPPAFPPRDEVRARLGISAQELVVGFVGRFSSQKAPEVMLDAFATVLRQRPDARLVMVGSGPLEEEVRRRIDQNGLGSKVKLLGDVVATTVMPAFDLFCLSSRYEGMPYVLVEALAAGLPIVSTQVGGANLCVEPEQNGLIVPPDDPGALAAGIASILSDPQRRRRFATASSAIATRFTADRMVAETLEVYQRVLGESV
jgi:glycosyltransferase involved in cell wall biosynthesis